MNIDQAFPSKYLKAADLAGKTYRMTITGVHFEDIGDDQRKLVATLAGAQKALVINRTNAEAIAIVYGRDTDNWIGKTIELFSMRVQGPNGMTDGIRVRGITAQSGPVQQSAQAFAPSQPVQVGQVLRGTVSPDMPPPAKPGDFDSEAVDDSIPF